MTAEITCREFIEFLDAFCEGSLEADTRAMFESHLEVCRACREYLEEYRTVVRLTRALGVPTNTLVCHEAAPPNVIEAVRRAISKHPR